MKNANWMKLSLPVLGLCIANLVSAQSYNATNSTPSLDRWMYANNASPETAAKSSSFAFFGEDFDTRWAQYIMGFDTSSVMATNQGAQNYLIKRVHLTLEIRLNNAFDYDPTFDSYRTYLDTSDPRYLPDSDDGRPVELYGVDYRNGYTRSTFVQSSDFGVDVPAGRNAYAACYSTNGSLVDVANNVGKTNALYPAFEVYPFAIGQTTNVAPGQPVPQGAKMMFDLNLNDPLVCQYVQEALNQGCLDLSVATLHGSGGIQSTLGFPAFWTSFNQVGSAGPVLEIEATLVRTNDTDADGLPDDWEQFYFHSLSQNATNDPDGDGQNNLAEYRAGTDPTDAASRLNITSLTRAGSNAYALQFPPAASHQYVIEYSTSLTVWSALTNAPLTYYTTPGAQWRDDGSQTGGSAPNRYYRIRVQ